MKETKPQHTIKSRISWKFPPFRATRGLRCDYTDRGTSDTRGGRCFDVRKPGILKRTRRFLYDGFAICQQTAVATLADPRQATHWQTGPPHSTAVRLMIRRTGPQFIMISKCIQWRKHQLLKHDVFRNTFSPTEYKKTRDYTEYISAIWIPLGRHTANQQRPVGLCTVRCDIIAELV